MKKLIITAIAALLVGAGVGYYLHQPSTVRYGDTSHLSGGLSMGSNTGVNQTDGLTTQATSGACSTASTTLFAILNPFGATSTVVMGEIAGTQGATTTDIVIGTSTTPYSGVDSTNYNAALLNMNFMALSSVATSTQFFAASGAVLNQLSTATTTNYYGTTTRNKVAITVGPSESLIGYSTSTTPGLGNGSTASGLRSIPSSCYYSFEWQR